MSQYTVVHLIHKWVFILKMMFTSLFPNSIFIESLISQQHNNHLIYLFISGFI